MVITDIVKEREGLYGHPYDNFNTVAMLWSAYINAARLKRGEVELTREDVGHMMILFKVARTINQTGDDDTIDDIAGYAECIHMIRRKQSNVE
jgi:hypothetical protein